MDDPTENSKDVTKILDYIVKLHLEDVGEMDLPFKVSKKRPASDAQIKNLNSIVDEIWDELKWSLTVDLDSNPIPFLDAQKRDSLKLAIARDTLNYTFLKRFVSVRWDAFSKKREKPKKLTRSKATMTTETTETTKKTKTTRTPKTTKTAKTTKATKATKATKKPRKESTPEKVD